MIAVRDAPPRSTADSTRAAPRLFLLSFAALFLELMVIRWVPSEVRLVAYYANLMLVSSFLGLGLGALLGGRRANLFALFPALLAADLLFLVGAGQLALPGGTSEWRFQIPQTKAYSYAILALVFVLNAAVFVPLGAEIGAQFRRLPPLRAYVWDLCGSLAGTIAFGVFSFLHFSPLLGLLGVAALTLALAARGHRWRSVPFLIVALLAVGWSMQRETTWWSPYYFITVRENVVKIQPATAGRPASAWLEEAPATAPPPDLRTMADPPLFTVKVNQDFYQMHGTIDARRYTPGSVKVQLFDRIISQYELPYGILPKHSRVLVLGAGGGMDVEMALLRGATHVDAVEIDPVIPRLSDRYSAAAPYRDPRVTLHVDDARAFLQRDRGEYDLVVFGFLDSQALFSYGASLRLDGYTYTVEGFRAAFARVAGDGALVVSFVAGRGWMARKLAQMIELATGRPALAYACDGQMVLIVSRAPLAAPPAQFRGWERVTTAPAPVDLATDDWPYLYLAGRGIPRDYAIIIGVLLVLSLGALLGLRGTRFGASDAHFLFLGWGFLLLQTKSIGDCSLYFGTTWLVTTLVIAGVLLMVLLANGVALRFLAKFRPALYLSLFVALALTAFMPRELILAQDPAWRVAWTLLIVPLPIFFAGLIFSATFRVAPDPARALGANLIGATIGGFSEYLGMWTGSAALGALVLATYAASLLCARRSFTAA